jgi:hypothetical protein
MAEGRSKGQKFMLECCRALSHWWFATPLDAHYTTLPMRPKSTVVAPMEGWSRKGDLDVDPRYSEDWPFSCECKKIEGTDQGWKELERLFEQPKYPLWKWWEQCVAQAETWENARPLLIFSRNRRRTYVLARARTLEWLDPRPTAGPIALLTRPTGERLGLLLLDDLVAVERPRPRSRKKRSRGK